MITACPQAAAPLPALQSRAGESKQKLSVCVAARSRPVGVVRRTNVHSIQQRTDASTCVDSSTNRYRRPACPHGRGGHHQVDRWCRAERRIGAWTSPDSRVRTGNRGRRSKFQRPRRENPLRAPGAAPRTSVRVPPPIESAMVPVVPGMEAGRVIRERYRMAQPATDTATWSREPVSHQGLENRRESGREASSCGSRGSPRKTWCPWRLQLPLRQLPADRARRYVLRTLGRSAILATDAILQGEPFGLSTRPCNEVRQMRRSQGFDSADERRLLFLCRRHDGGARPANTRPGQPATPAYRLDTPASTQAANQDGIFKRHRRPQPVASDERRDRQIESRPDFGIPAGTDSR